MKGTVRWFDARKGYGFVVGEDGSDYLHWRQLPGNGYRVIFSQKQVEFEASRDKTGRVALNVREI